jgi:hypothetical protein
LVGKTDQFRAGGEIKAQNGLPAPEPYRNAKERSIPASVFRDWAEFMGSKELLLHLAQASQKINPAANQNCGAKRE